MTDLQATAADLDPNSRPDIRPSHTFQIMLQPDPAFIRVDAEEYYALVEFRRTVLALGAIDPDELRQILDALPPL